MILLSQPPVVPPPDEQPPPSRVPFSKPPARSANWWKSIPGQFAILAIAVGAVVIFCQVSGLINFR